MEQEIAFRSIIEVLGKPRLYVEEALKGYIKDLEQDKHFLITTQQLMPAEQQPNSEMWATFAELEMKTPSLKHLIDFCFNYMPSMIEIISPTEVKFNDSNASEFLSDLQAKLHQVDMVAKQFQAENQFLTRSLGSLLKNYVTLILSRQNLTSEQISLLTGVNKDKLEDFLDQLIDEGKIDLKEGIYILKKEVSI